MPRVALLQFDEREDCDTLDQYHSRDGPYKPSTFLKSFFEGVLKVLSRIIPLPRFDQNVHPTAVERNPMSGRSLCN